jgi:hypothetical protein
MSTCAGCKRPLEEISQIRVYHSGCDPFLRIETLEKALLDMREIALECCRASDVPRITEIAKGAFKGREG